MSLFGARPPLETTNRTLGTALDDLRLANPAWLLTLVLLPLPWLWQWWRPRLAWPTLSGFADAPRRWAPIGRLLPPLLRSLALACLAVALARPQTVGGQIRIASRGVAVVVALDRSPSMEAEDFPDPDAGLISRFEAARRTFTTFVEGRPDDLVGLVAFARHPDLVCPPTLDHGFLVDTATALRSARPEESGTNIGDAIAWSLDALLAATPERKVLVLLTDGHNQAAGVVPPPLPPIVAAEIARDLGVTIHTIGVGQSGIIREVEELTGLGRPVGESEGPDLELLGELARIGGGRMFVATDSAALDAVFRAIDALERSELRGTIRTRYHEWYPPWVGAAAVLLGLDRLLAAGRLRRLP